MKEIDTSLSFLRTESHASVGGVQSDSKSDRGPTDAEVESLCQSVIDFVKNRLQEIYDRSSHSSHGSLRFFVSKLPLPVSSSSVIHSIVHDIYEQTPELKTDVIPVLVVPETEVPPPPPVSDRSLLLSAGSTDNAQPPSKVADGRNEPQSVKSNSLSVTPIVLVAHTPTSESKSEIHPPAVSHVSRSGPCKIAYIGTYQSGIRTSYLSSRISVTGSLPQKELDAMKFGIQNSLIESFQELSSFILQRIPTDKKSDIRVSGMRTCLEQLVALPSISMQEDDDLLRRWCTSISEAWSMSSTKNAWHRSRHRLMV